MIGECRYRFRVGDIHAACDHEAVIVVDIPLTGGDHIAAPVCAIHAEAVGAICWADRKRELAAQ